MKASAVSTITKSLPIALSVLVNYSLLATLGYINLFFEKNLYILSKIYFMKKVLSIFLFTALLSCNKEQKPEQNISREVIIQKINSEIISQSEEPKEKFVELACVINDCAGILCTRAPGNCKKEKECTPIPGGCLPDQSLSASEIEIYANEYAKKMLEEGFIDEEDMNNSRALAIDLLKKFKSRR